MQSKKRVHIRNLILIISGILILGILGVYAGTTLSNSPSAYLNSDNLTINSTGINYVTSTGFNKITDTYDTVICRGNNVLDDLIKQFSCDINCPSTTNDCQPYIMKAIGSNCNNKNILIKSGVYPIITRDQIGGTGYLVTYCSNATILGYNAYLIVNYTTDNVYQKGFENEGNNNYFYGLSLIGNKLCGSNSCYGFRNYGGSNVYYKDVNSFYVNGFQFTTESIGTNPNLNVHYDTIHTKGVGTADTLGGGRLSNGLFVTNSLFEQISDVGGYNIAVDLVNLTNWNFENNILYGGLVIGSEEGNSSNINFIGNIINKPVGVSTQQILLWSSLDYDTNINIIGNYLDGNYSLKGTNISVIGNTFTSGQPNFITDNQLILKGSNPSLNLIARIPAIEFNSSQGQDYKLANSYVDSSSLSLIDVTHSNAERVRFKSDGYVAFAYRVCLGDLNCAHYIDFNGTCMRAQGINQTGNCL